MHKGKVLSNSKFIYNELTLICSFVITQSNCYLRRRF